jgi:ketosteroid isomerase-like protein
MNNSQEQLIERFYTAFQKGDYSTMKECYHPQATFRDPVFLELSATEVRAMWQMLLTSARDLVVAFRGVTANTKEGSVHWEAWYTFSRTGRKVHNSIESRMQFRDGKIFRHVDSFSFWRWSQQALGISGLVLGWTPIVQNKVRKTAKRSLEKFMAARDES